MSNYEYDALYDELAALEKETGVVLAGSPTQSVGYQVLGELPKEAHGSPWTSSGSGWGIRGDFSPGKWTA